MIDSTATAVVSTVFRQQGRSRRCSSSFTHPGRVYLLHEAVRSTAVRDGKPPEISGEELVNLAREVRCAINEFLDFAKSEGYPKRGRLLAALRADSDAAEIGARFLPMDPRGRMLRRLAENSRANSSTRELRAPAAGRDVPRSLNAAVLPAFHSEGPPA